MKKFIYMYRDMRFILTRNPLSKLWKMRVDGVAFAGFKMTETFSTKAIASFYAKKEIDGILGKSVKKIMKEIF